MHPSQCMPVLTRCQTAVPVVDKLGPGSCQRVSVVQNAGTQQYGVARDVRASRKSTNVLPAGTKAAK
jgi:hypothetical protein